MKYNKICWELMEIIEKQAKTIKELSMKIKELESIIDSELQQQFHIVATYQKIRVVQLLGNT